MRLLHQHLNPVGAPFLLTAPSCQELPPPRIAGARPAARSELHLVFFLGLRSLPGCARARGGAPTAAAGRGLGACGACPCVRVGAFWTSSFGAWLFSVIATQNNRGRVRQTVYTCGRGLNMLERGKSRPAPPNKGGICGGPLVTGWPLRAREKTERAREGAPPSAVSVRRRSGLFRSGISQQRALDSRPGWEKKDRGPRHGDKGRKSGALCWAKARRHRLPGRCWRCRVG